MMIPQEHEHTYSICYHMHFSHYPLKTSPLTKHA